MNRQRKVLVTVTYNELGVIVDTKTEELDSSAQPVDKDINVPTNDSISRQAAINALGDKPLAWTEGEYELGLQNQWQSDVDALKELPSAQPEQSIAEWQKDFREYINMLNIPRDDYKGIMEYINEVPSAQPNLESAYAEGYTAAEADFHKLRDAQPRWISVAEQLPEEDIEVLTYDSSFGITFDSLHREKWRKHPVAWMPLPEPYKGETE